MRETKIQTSTKELTILFPALDLVSDDEDKFSDCVSEIFDTEPVQDDASEVFFDCEGAENIAYSSIVSIDKNWHNVFTALAMLSGVVMVGGIGYIISRFNAAEEAVTFEASAKIVISTVQEAGNLFVDLTKHVGDVSTQLVMSAGWFANHHLGPLIFNATSHNFLTGLKQIPDSFQTLPSLKEPIRPKLRITSLNVNYFRPNEIGLFAAALPEWRFIKRFPLIVSHIEAHMEQGSNIFTFQEIHSDYLDRMLIFLKSKGLQCQTTQYAPEPGAFYLITAFDPAIYVLSAESTVLYYTESGQATNPKERLLLPKEEKIRRHLGTEFEKCALFVKLQKLETSEEYIIINTHLGLDQPGLDLNKPEDMAKSHRLLAAQKLADAIRKLHDKVIIAGDFNSFVPGAPLPSILEAQIKILMEAGLIWQTEQLGRTGSQSTFLASPGDLGLVRSKLHPQNRTTLDEIIKKDNPIELRRFLGAICSEQSVNDKVFALDLRGGVLDQVFTNFDNPAEVQTTIMLSSGLERRDNIDAARLSIPQTLFGRSLKNKLPSDDLESDIDSDHHAVCIEFK